MNEIGEGGIRHAIAMGLILSDRSEKLPFVHRWSYPKPTPLICICDCPGWSVMVFISFVVATFFQFQSFLSKINNIYMYSVLTHICDHCLIHCLITFLLSEVRPTNIFKTHKN